MHEMRRPGRPVSTLLLVLATLSAIAVPPARSAEQGSEGGSIGGSIDPPPPRAEPPRAAPPPARPRPVAEPRRDEPRRAEPSRGAVTPAPGKAYSFPVNTQPDGWAALRSAPGGRGERLLKVYDGTLFAVIGSEGQWVHVRLPSGETGWIIGRLVGCCVYRP